MKIFEIIDEDKEKTVGALLYFEKERTCIVELQEYLDEWSAPFLFASYVKNKVYTIPRDVSALVETFRGDRSHLSVAVVEVHN